MSNSYIVERNFDPDNPPPLTPKQIAMLDALEKKQDSEIDFSDIPELNFLNCQPKRQTTVSIDIDVLDWLHSFGKGYQTKINAILRHEMLNYKAKT
jgi:uncharacterized protein (DUF4415 family)